MAASRILLLLLATIFARIEAAGVVKELTPDDFDKVVGGNKNVLIEFYASWCGHCKALAPEYEKLGRAYKGVKNTIIARIDADRYRSVGSKHDVVGFPTIKFFPKQSKKATDTYNDERTAELMVEFLNTKTGNLVTVVQDPDTATALDDNSFAAIVHDPAKHVLVHFYAPWCGHCKRMAGDYEAVARAFRDEPHVVVAKYDADQNKVYGEQYGVTGYPALKLFLQNNTAVITFDGARDGESIVGFINEHTGCQRALDGTLLPEAGVLATLEWLVADFMANPSKELLDKAIVTSQQLEGEHSSNARYYLTFMDKILKEGKPYVKSERKRLQKVLEGGSMSSKLVREMQIKRNILDAFLRTVKAKAGSK
mmetsp:Transcript_55922/g.131673  ORF Transcript_55922/g.131673 Transcript_55922/m.131673 type:complete len:367 (+) Transcript_55922:95-1195(+)